MMTDSERRKKDPRAPFSREEMDAFRAALIERRTKLRERLERLSGRAAQDNPAERGEISSLPMHLADLGTETYEQQTDLGFAERDRDTIAAIDRALERIEEGTYGMCENCGRPISKERLQALPFAALCRDCQAKEEAA
jgi:RNA polymerase-binding protein DksA